MTKISIIVNNSLPIMYFRVTGGELFEDIVAREFYSEADARWVFCFIIARGGVAKWLKCLPLPGAVGSSPAYSHNQDSLYWLARMIYLSFEFENLFHNLAKISMYKLN